VGQIWAFPAFWLALVICGRALTIHQGTANLTAQLYFPAHNHSDGLARGLLLAWITTFRPAWFAYVFALAVSYGIAFFTFQLIERPFLSLRARMVRPREKRESIPEAELSQQFA